MTPHREHFWNLEAIWLFYVLVAVALTAFAYGIWRQVRRWRSARSSGYRLSWRRLLKVFPDAL